MSFPHVKWLNVESENQINDLIFSKTGFYWECWCPVPVSLLLCGSAVAKIGIYQNIAIWWMSEIAQVCRQVLFFYFFIFFKKDLWKPGCRISQQNIWQETRWAVLLTFPVSELLFWQMMDFFFTLNILYGLSFTQVTFQWCKIYDSMLKKLFVLAWRGVFIYTCNCWITLLYKMVQHFL